MGREERWLEGRKFELLDASAILASSGYRLGTDRPTQHGPDISLSAGRATRPGSLNKFIGLREV